MGASLGGGLFAGLGAVAPIAGIAAIGLGLGKAVTLGSDLNETINKVGVIFGDQAGTVTKAADEMASKFGIVKTTFMDASSTIGNLLVGMGGMTNRASAEMSVQLSKAAADASSIFNVSFGEATEKIGAALRGQSEPISAFGIDVQEAAVKMDALAHGAKLVNGELTTQDKVAARARVVMAGLKVAEGDLADTSSGFANSSRALFGRLENAGAALGQTLMPVFEGLLGHFNRGVGAVEDWFLKSKPAFDGFIAGVIEVGEYAQWGFGQVVEAITSLGERLTQEITGHDAYKASIKQIGYAYEWMSGVAKVAFNAVGIFFRNFSTLAGVAGLRVYEFAINAGEAFTWLGDAAGQFIGWFGANWTRLFKDAFDNTLTLLQNFIDNLKIGFSAIAEAVRTQSAAPLLNLEFKPMLDGFKSTIDALPEIARPVFTSLQQDIDGLWEKMKGVEEAHDARAAEAKEETKEAARARERAKPGSAAAKGGKDKVEQLGLAEFAKKLQAGIFGKDDDAKATAKNTASAAASLGVIAGKLVGEKAAGQLPPGGGVLARGFRPRQSPRRRGRPERTMTAAQIADRLAFGKPRPMMPAGAGVFAGGRAGDAALKARDDRAWAARLTADAKARRDQAAAWATFRARGRDAAAADRKAKDKEWFEGVKAKAEEKAAEGQAAKDTAKHTEETAALIKDFLKTASAPRYGLAR